MSDVDAFLAGGVPRDHHGHYMIVDPRTGEVVPWVRTTTAAETISDRRGLERWTQRGLVRGLAARPDLIERAREAGDDKDALGAIVDEALEAADIEGKARLGTLLHNLTEMVDRGEMVL